MEQASRSSQGALFPSVRQYAAAFTLLLINAIFVSSAASRPHQDTATGSMVISIAMTVGMLCCSLALLDALKRTSNKVEIGCILMLELLCVLFLIEAPSRFTSSWPRLSFTHLLFAIISCAVAVIAGIRLAQVGHEARQQRSR